MNRFVARIRGLGTPKKLAVIAGIIVVAIVVLVGTKFRTTPSLRLGMTMDEVGAALGPGTNNGLDREGRHWMEHDYEDWLGHRWRVSVEIDGDLRAIGWKTTNLMPVESPLIRWMKKSWGL
jgi:hypothetical protein